MDNYDDNDSVDDDDDDTNDFDDAMILVMTTLIKTTSTVSMSTVTMLTGYGDTDVYNLNMYTNDDDADDNDDKRLSHAHYSVSRPHRYSDARVSHYDEMNALRESGGVS